MQEHWEEGLSTCFCKHGTEVGKNYGWKGPILAPHGSRKMFKDANFKPCRLQFCQKTDVQKSYHVAHGVQVD